MRVIDVFEDAVEAVAVSPDGRFLAAVTGEFLAVLDWVSGREITCIESPQGFGQPAFTVDGNWLAYHSSGWLRSVALNTGGEVRIASGMFASGLAASPDGKMLAGVHTLLGGNVRLERWSIPSWRSAGGFDYWSRFERMAFSPNGEFLAGINRDAFELRVAVSGGKNGWHRLKWRSAVAGFFAFPRDSQTVIFGWDTEFQVMETRGGSSLKWVASPGGPFADAAFTGSGRHLATVDRTSVMRLWSAESWQVFREYDWQAGPLTCLTVTEDGLAGVCGTANGKLVVFDVDE